MITPSVNTAAQVLSNITATSAPTANDDSSQGYAVGSVWMDTVGQKVYNCFDATVGAAVWMVGTIGPQGNQGFVGSQGSVGAQGNQGPVGSQGSTGSQGNQGSVGSQGNQGSVGSQGNQGSVGSQGSTGSQGNQGFQGVSGTSSLVTYQATSAAGAQSTASAYTDIAGMTLTPVAGTYSAHFSSEMSCASANQQVDYGVSLAGGAPIAASIRSVMPRPGNSANATNRSTVHTHCDGIVANGAQAVTVQWKNSGSAQMDMFDRTLTLFKAA